MYEIFLVITPLFLIIFGSAFVGRKHLESNWTEVLNSFALNVGLPALIFISIAEVSFEGQFYIVLANSLFILISFLIVYVLGKVVRIKEKTIKTIFICLAFGNIAYLGIPVLTQIYGQKILPNASLIIGVHLFWLFTIGLGYLDYSLAKRQSWFGKFLYKKSKQDIIKHISLDLIKNPLLIAIFFGILVAIMDIRIPKIISSAIDMLAASVTPVVLVVIGLFIGRSQIGRLKEWLPVLAFTIVTLFILPGGFYLALKIFSSNPDKYIPTMIMTAMPLAITPFALADKFGLDKKFIARAIVLSTIISIISIPIWATVL